LCYRLNEESEEETTALDYAESCLDTLALAVGDPVFQVRVFSRA